MTKYKISMTLKVQKSSWLFFRASAATCSWRSRRWRGRFSKEPRARESRACSLEGKFPVNAAIKQRLEERGIHDQRAEGSTR